MKNPSEYPAIRREDWFTCNDERVMKISDPLKEPNFVLDVVSSVLVKNEVEFLDYKIIDLHNISNNPPTEYPSFGVHHILQDSHTYVHVSPLFSRVMAEVYLCNVSRNNTSRSLNILDQIGDGLFADEYLARRSHQVPPISG